MSDTFVQDFESKLFELFPDAKTNGVVKNSELLDTMRAMGTTKQPKWLMVNKVGRGLYAIDGSKAPVAGNLALKPEESFIVDYTDLTSLIPKKDSNFVPFGNFTEEMRKQADQLAVVSRFIFSRDNTLLTRGSETAP